MTSDDEAEAQRLMNIARRWQWVMNSGTLASCISMALSVTYMLFGLPPWWGWSLGVLIPYAALSGLVAHWRIHHNMERAGRLIFGPGVPLPWP